MPKIRNDDTLEFRNQRDTSMSLLWMLESLFGTDSSPFSPPLFPLFSSAVAYLTLPLYWKYLSSNSYFLLTYSIAKLIIFLMISCHERLQKHGNQTIITFEIYPEMIYIINQFSKNPSTSYTNIFLESTPNDPWLGFRSIFKTVIMLHWRL